MSTGSKGFAVATHGQSGTRLHSMWNSMKANCSNPKASGWKYFGGRGVTVCDEWRADFQAFARDVGQPPTKRHVLGLIKESLGYRPGNVRWVPAGENHRARAAEIKAVALTGDGGGGVR